jgi:hypothetical protein
LENFLKRGEFSVKHKHGKTGQVMVFIAVRFKRRQKGTDINKGIIFIFKIRLEQCFANMNKIKKLFKLTKGSNGNEFKSIRLIVKIPF